jgi:hypothetical protein
MVVRDLEAAMQTYVHERGNAVLLSGEFSGIRVAHLATDRELGMITEIFSGTPGAELKPDAT